MNRFCCGCCSWKVFVGAPVLVAALMQLNPIFDRLIVPDDVLNPFKSPKVAFDPSRTSDVLGYEGLNFLSADKDPVPIRLGVGFFVLNQAFPKWVTHLYHTQSGWYDRLEKMKELYVPHTVDILDARKRDDMQFAETGFALIKLEEPTQVKQWRGLSEIGLFQEQLRPYLHRLIPAASRFEFTYNVIRGGHHIGDQPAAINSPHLDYSQDDVAREAFHKVHPLVPFATQEPMYMMGMNDTDDEECRALLGIWKPVMMSSPICDHPLALLDARTLDSRQIRSNALHMDFGFFAADILQGTVSHNESQQWYYYSHQNDDEVVVFHQYSKGRFFTNPHTSFVNPNCPDDTETRISVEMRAAVFFPKDSGPKEEEKSGSKE